MTLPFLAVTLTPASDTTETLVFVAIGFFIVMAALATLWGVFTFTGSIFKRLQSTAKIEAEPQLKPAEESSTLTPQIEAVIVAAVASIVGGPHRVISVKPSDSRQASSWAMEGRTRHMGSHRVR